MRAACHSLAADALFRACYMPAKPAAVLITSYCCSHNNNFFDWTSCVLLACLSQEISGLRANKEREAKEAEELVEVSSASGEQGFQNVYLLVTNNVSSLSFIFACRCVMKWIHCIRKHIQYKYTGVLRGEGQTLTTIHVHFHSE